MGHQETERNCRDLEEDKEMNIKFFFLTVGYQLILLSMFKGSGVVPPWQLQRCFFFKLNAARPALWEHQIQGFITQADMQYLEIIALPHM